MLLFCTFEKKSIQLSSLKIVYIENEKYFCFLAHVKRKGTYYDSSRVHIFQSLKKSANTHAKKIYWQVISKHPCKVALAFDYISVD